MAGAALPALAPATANDPAGSAASIFNVRQFGAAGDGKTLDTPARQSRHCSGSGRGRRHGSLPRRHVPLLLDPSRRAASKLYLDAGVTILAADSPKPGESTGWNGGRYDVAEPNTAWDAYQDYGHNHWHNSLLWGEEIHDLSITGTGLSTARASASAAGPRPLRSTVLRGFGTEPSPARPRRARPVRPIGSRSRAHFGPRGNYPMYQAEQVGVGNKAIALKNCRTLCCATSLF